MHALEIILVAFSAAWFSIVAAAPSWFTSPTFFDAMVALISIHLIVGITKIIHKGIVLPARIVPRLSFGPLNDQRYSQSPGRRFGIEPLEDRSLLTVIVESGDFVAEVSRLSDLAFGSDSNLYIAPSSQEQADFKSLADTLLAGDVAASDSQAGSLGYQVIEYTDTVSSGVYHGLREQTAGGVQKGWGSFFVNLDFHADALVEVPHPLFDTNSWDVGAKVFRDAGARGFLMAGAHRNANGTDTADVANRSESIFQEVHESWVGTGPVTDVWQIHGFDIDNHTSFPSGTDVVLSNGDGSVSSEVIDLDARFEANAFLSHVYNTLSSTNSVNVQVNGGVNGGTFSGLAAMGNRQGIHSRSLNGTFVHVELEQSIRFNPTNLNLAVVDITDSLFAESRFFATGSGIRSAANGSELDVTIDFDAAVDATTLQLSDLIVNGASRATDVTLEDVNTATFTLPALPGGAHSLRIDAGTIIATDGTALGEWTRTFDVAADAQFHINHSPRLQLGDQPLVGYMGSSTDRVELLWQTVSAGSGTQDSFNVEYRLSGNLNSWSAAPTTSQIPIPTGGRINHYTTITGLSYDTDYEYRVRHFSANVVVAEFHSTFHTRLAAGDPTTFSFAAYGDSADVNNIAPFRSVQSRVNTVDPAFTLLLGDNAYDFGTHDESDARFDPNINPEAAAWTAGHIDYVGFGNHDVGTDGGQPGEDNFSVPIPVVGVTAPASVPAGEEPEHNYSFDYGNVHFVTFDTNSLNNPTRLNNQLTWMEADLAATTAQWKIVFGHHPVTGSPDKPESAADNYYQQVVPRLRMAGVDVFLMGHSHTYHRTYPLLGESGGVETYALDTDNSYTQGAGLIQLVAGTGGKSLRSGTFTQFPFNAVGFSLSTTPVVEYGFAKFDVTPTELTVSYIAADDGATLDQFTIVAEIDVSAPTASLVAPMDNGSRDVNTTINAVTTGFTQAVFQIQLSDDQAGIDDASVSASSVTVIRETEMLIEGIDYTFAYDATRDLITLATNQLFDEATYQIEITGVKDQSANVITPATLHVIIDQTQATSFALAVLPDTQFYSESFPSQFNAQTQWVADHITTDNLVFVTHVGDVVQNGGQGVDRNKSEWDRANIAMSILDGNLLVNPDGLIPYAVAPGNHDYDIVHNHGSATRFVEFFGASRYNDRSWYFGSSQDQLNHYQVFNGGGFQILHITLEWEPRASALSWAQGVIETHPDLPVVLSTHAYLQASGNRFATPSSSDGHSGEDIYQQLVRPNPQVFMVLNGHFAGEAHQISTNHLGQDVIEILADYQNRPNGGDGWTRLLEFLPHENRIDVKTYSPTLDQFETDADSQFSIDINFSERFNLSFPPTARLGNPLDNGPNDIDSAVGRVTVNTTQTNFQIQLDDINDGVDDTTVINTTVAVTKDLVSLVESVDYTFSYDTVGDVITLTSLVGAFGNGNYQIGLNSGVGRIADVGGNELVATTQSVTVDTSIQPQRTETFQQDVAGFSGTVDTFFQEASANANNSSATSLNVDGDDPSSSGQDVQVLVRFDNILGNDIGQIPAGSQIDSASLDLQVSNPGDSVAVHRMLKNWSDTDTWNSLASGVQDDGAEATVTADVTTGSVATGLLSVDVTNSLETWSADPTRNFGWVLLPTGNNGVDVSSSEGATPPKLTVTFIPPSPDPVPTAVSDSYRLAQDSGTTTLAPAVTSNDDFGGDGPAAAAIVIVSPPSQAAAVVNDNGTPTDPTDDTIDYTPNANYNGPDQLIYRISDSNGDQSNAIVNITVDPVNNNSPIAEAGGIYSADEGSSVMLDGSGSMDPDGVNDLVRYDWDLDGDGVYETSGVSVAFNSTADGNFTVGLRVTDNAGDVSIDTAQVTVNNVAPTANAGVSYSTNVGTDVTVTAAASSDPGNDITRYDWDLDNDGLYDDHVGVTATFNSAMAGTFAVGVQVTDDDGAATTDLATVTVTDSTAVAILDEWVFDGSYASQDATFEVSAGTNRIVVVALSAEKNQNGPISVASVSLGGQVLTQQIYLTVGSSAAYHNLHWVGYLLEADIANLSSSELAISYANAPSNPFDEPTIHYASYQNVDQITPIADFNSNSSTSASSLQLSSTLAAGDGDKIVGFNVIGQHYVPGLSTSGYTEETEFIGATNGHASAVYDRTATTSVTANPTFTVTASTRMAVSAIVLNRAVAVNNNSPIAEAGGIYSADEGRL